MSGLAGAINFNNESINNFNEKLLRNYLEKRAVLRFTIPECMKEYSC